MKTVVAVQFYSSGTKIIALVDNSPMTFITLNSADGSLIKSYFETGTSTNTPEYWFSSSAFIKDTNSDHVYVGMQLYLSNRYT